jgi:proline-specific peptidase
MAHLTLNELIGDTSHLLCEVLEFEIKGLKVRSWKYSHPERESLTPIIAIHGGPGFPHNYMLPLKLMANYGHPVIFYDQAGCGSSTNVSNVSEVAPWLLTVEYYIEELETLIQTYSLSQFFLYGSSWGTIVAQEAAVAGLKGLKGMILDGALCDAQQYISTQWRDRISTMPTYTQNLLKSLEEQKAYNSKLYRALTSHLGMFFTCRIFPTPISYSESAQTANGEIYLAMQGPSEFSIGGVLEFWSISERLCKSVDNIPPTLVMVGEFDSMSIECSQAIVDNISKASPLVVVPRSSHMKLLEEPHFCIDSVRKFIEAIP